jgi:ribosomal protein L27
MLRITVDLIPRGDERAAQRVGTVEIENDRTGDETTGNYRVRQRGTVTADVRLTGLQRTEGLWALASAALAALQG